MTALTPPTPGQTVGPFFGYALPYDGDSELVPPATPGRDPAARPGARRRRRAGAGRADRALAGRRPDGSVPRPPGSLHRDGYTFTGWGRAAPTATGRYSFTTLRPGRGRRGAVLRGDGLRPRPARPAVHPGLPAGACGATRCSPPAPSAGTLVAPDDHGFVFDIRLQGEDETVFLPIAGH